MPKFGDCRRRSPCKGGPCSFNTGSGTAHSCTGDALLGKWRKEYIWALEGELDRSQSRVKGLCGTFQKCFDVQPPRNLTHNSCDKQLRNTDLCEQRLAGTLDDGYCAKTCGVCQDCPDLSGYYSYAASHNGQELGHVRMNQTACSGIIDSTSLAYSVKGTVSHTYNATLVPTVMLSDGTAGTISGSKGSHTIEWSNGFIYVQMCPPAGTSAEDPGPDDGYSGWYDVNGCGTCNDYCRWVGGSAEWDDAQSGGNPADRMSSGSVFWSCRLAGSSDPYTPENYFTTWPHAKCLGQGDIAPKALQDLGKCSADLKCRQCQGDCDSDSDCYDNLKCHKRSSSRRRNLVPGCGEGGVGDKADHDYCIAD